MNKAKYPSVKLNECIKLSSGKFLPAKKRIDGSYIVYGGNGISGNHNDYFVEEPTIVIGRVGEYCGCVHISNAKSWITDNALYVTNFLKEFDIRYLCYVLNKENLNRLANVSGQPSISQANILNSSIKVPPLDIQKYIGETLDKVKEIINLHKKRLEELDNLIKSTFYDMFGDPVINEEKWQTKKMLEVCDKITDGTHDTPARYNEGILFVTGKNIKPFEIDLKEVEFVSQEDHEIIYKRCNPEFKDILYTNIGVNYGTAAINLLEYEFSMKNVALLKYKRNMLTGEYLQCYLNYKREYIVRQNKTGGAQTFMGLSTIKKLEIQIPPIELQNKFAKIITKIEEQKILEKQAISESENLFNSLMSKYFD